MSTTTKANGQGQCALRSVTPPLYIIQALTKRGKGWKDVSDAGSHRIIKECAAEGFIGRKFPQRIAVRVIELRGGEYSRETFRKVNPRFIGEYHNGYGLWDFRAS
jgi:hypothetical protein